MSDPIIESHTAYLDAMEALGEQRRQIEEDQRFSDPANPQQWDETERNQREHDPGGPRPCLTHDQIGQYVSNVAGQIEQRPPSIHAIPVGSGADKKVAEAMDGFFRHIEHSSRAQQHYARAGTSAARVGVGYLTIRPTFVDQVLGYQEPRISSEGDALKVIFDPSSEELDGSDAQEAWILTELKQAEFKRRYGEKAELVSFAETERRKAKSETEGIVVAEHWRMETSEVVCLVVVDLASPDRDEFTIDEDEFNERSKQADFSLQVVQDDQGPRRYKEKRRVVKWSHESGSEYLSNTVDGKPGPVIYPASAIGVIPVYGYVAWEGGRMKYCGIPRRAMAAQRSYNYHISEMRAYMNDAPKAPWLVSKRAARGVEDLWDNASKERRAWLPFNDIDEQGTITAPTRPNIASNLSNHQAGAADAKVDIQAAVALFQANLGAPSNETSGVAIDARKEQGEASNAHFPSHLAASLGQVGKIVGEMVPKLIDTRRQVRVLGFDQTPSTVTVDPQQKSAVQETPAGLSINPSIGRYDWRVVVGANFSTQRSQAQAAFTEMMRANPAMTPAIAPLWAKTLDVPDADKLSQVLTAMAPPEVKAILQPQNNEGPTTAELVSEVQKLKDGLQQAIQHAEEAQAEMDEDKDRISKLEVQLTDKADEVEVRRYEAETKRFQVTGANEQQTQAIVQQMVGDILGQQAQVVSQHVSELVPQLLPQPEQPDPQEEEMREQTAQALIQGHAQLAAGQQKLEERIVQLMGLVARTRERIPVRNKDGDIERVIDRMTDEEQQPERAN